MTKPLIVEQVAEAAYEEFRARTGSWLHGMVPWSETSQEIKLDWRLIADAAFKVFLDMNRAERAYYDPRQNTRSCDCCQRPYRGPSVYCSFECALDDGAPWSAQPPLEP